MKVSLNYLRKYIDFDLPAINKLVDIIGSRLGALDEVPVKLGEIYKDVVVVKIVDCQPIEGSDHLNLCLIDDGQVVENVARDGNGLVSVVCGAPNVAKGLTVVWLPPGLTVPSTFFSEPLKLESRTIRGELSNGMLASAKELDIADDHSGILIIDQEAKPGTSFADLYELNDYIIDIENKMFTHRPDCFGILGVAREVSGILAQPFKSPDWYFNALSVESESIAKVNVRNEIPSLVPRFTLIALDNITVKPSPLIIQSYLYRMGIRPVNNIVDLTNLVMLETGQPLHAYDLNKLKKLGGDEVTMTIRLPRENETIDLLNGKKLELNMEAIGIAVGDQLVSLGGVMGGSNSEVDTSTTSILLEAASFDMYTIRRTSMTLGVFSEAVTRFTKGQSPLQTVRILSYAVSKLKEQLPEVKAVTSVLDDVHLPEETLKRDSNYPPITVNQSFINDRLGTDLSTQDMAKLLQSVECQVQINQEKLTVIAPFWRTDLEIREDVLEEVGRLFGYDNIKSVPLMRPGLATRTNKRLDNKAELRRLLAAAGANELLTYSFVSKRLVESAQQDVNQAFEIANSLSPELQLYRLSLTPSLLAKVSPNIKAGYDEFALFEIGTYHLVDRFSENEPEVPAEYPSLALIYASRKAQKQAAYFRAKQFLDYLLETLNISGIEFVPLDKVTDLADNLSELVKPYEPKRSALVKSADKQWGIVGEFKPAVLSSLKLPAHSAGFEINSDLFIDDQRDKVYERLSRYPSVKQDITLSVPAGPTYADLNSFLSSELNRLVPGATHHQFRLASIFKPDDQTTNYSFHLEIASLDKTLKDSEVNDMLDKLAATANQKFNAIRL